MSIKSRATKRTGYHPGFGPWGGRANYGGVGRPLATIAGRNRTAPTFMFGGAEGKPMRRLKETKGLTQWHLENGVVKTKVKCYDKCKHFALHYQHPDAETAGGVDTMANKTPFNRINVDGWVTDSKATGCDGTAAAPGPPNVDFTAATTTGVVTVTLTGDGATWRYSVNGGSTFNDGTGNTFTLTSETTYAGDDIQVTQSDATGNTSSVAKNDTQIVVPTL